MGFQPAAFFKALGISSAIFFFIYLCGLAVQFPAGISFGTVPDPNAIPPWYQAFSCVSTCVTYLLYVGAGVLYTGFARSGTEPSSMGQSALGGMFTGLGLFVVSLCLGALNFAFVWGSLIDQLEQQLALSGINNIAEIAPFLIIGLVVGVIFALVLIAAFGAAGGALGTAFFKQNEDVNTIDLATA